MKQQSWASGGHTRLAEYLNYKTRQSSDGQLSLKHSYQLPNESLGTTAMSDLGAWLIRQLLFQSLLKENVSVHWLKWFVCFTVTHGAKLTKGSARCEKITWLRRLIIIIAFSSVFLFSGIPYLYISFQNGSSAALSILSELLTASGFCLCKDQS